MSGYCVVTQCQAHGRFRVTPFSHDERKLSARVRSGSCSDWHGGGSLLRVAWYVGADPSEENGGNGRDLRRHGPCGLGRVRPWNYSFLARSRPRWGGRAGAVTCAAEGPAGGRNTCLVRRRKCGALGGTSPPSSRCALGGGIEYQEVQRKLTCGVGRVGVGARCCELFCLKGFVWCPTPQVLRKPARSLERGSFGTSCSKSRLGRSGVDRMVRSWLRGSRFGGSKGVLAQLGQGPWGHQNGSFANLGAGHCKHRQERQVFGVGLGGGCKRPPRELVGGSS